jgi:hypothetical protein
VAREKGIDVLVALTFLNLVTTAACDVAILVAHDTDQEPTLDMAIAAGASNKVTVETAGWSECKRIRPSANIRKPWHTFMAINHYRDAIDLKVYK